MKVKELPEDTNITKVKVRLPEDVLQSFKDCLGGEPEMWIAGQIMGEFFISPNSPETKERRLYPLPFPYLPNIILEWEVIE